MVTESERNRGLLHKLSLSATRLRRAIWHRNADAFNTAFGKHVAGHRPISSHVRAAHGSSEHGVGGSAHAASMHHGSAPHLQAVSSHTAATPTSHVASVRIDAATNVTTSPTTSYTNVGTAGQLSSDISAIDTASQQGAGSGTVYTISLASGAKLTESADLSAVNLNGSDQLVIEGNNATLDGADAYRGLFVYHGNVSISDLTIQNAAAIGGAGGTGAGGGAGLGGGLFIAGTGNVDASGNALVTGGNVTLSNVTFNNDAAIGGVGGKKGAVAATTNGAGTTGSGVSAGGGGGMGGNGGLDKAGGNAGGGGGGLGRGASGGSDGGAGQPGIVVGAAAGGHGGSGKTVSTGGSSGGGGGGGFPSNNTTEGAGGGGGVGGQDGQGFPHAGPNNKGLDHGGAGGFGGGGGGAIKGMAAGNGGFGGGGGAHPNSSSVSIGGAGGFGGGGGFEALGGFGGGNSATTSSGGGGPGVPNPGTGGGGGGGLGAGGAIFVQEGGQLRLAGNVTIGGAGGADTVSPGAAGGEAEAGQAFASGIYLQGNGGSLVFDTTNPDGSGAAQTVSDAIGDDIGSATAAGYKGPSGYTEGSVGVTVEGNGGLTLSGANTYTGTTTLEDTATLAGGAADTFSAASAFVVGKGTNIFLEYDQTIASLADGAGGGGEVTAGFNTATLTIAGAATTSFSGTIVDGSALFGGVQPLTLDKAGTGTQTLAGANTYSGGTTIDAGTLDLDAADTVGGNGAVTAGAAGTAAITFAGTGDHPATLALERVAQPGPGDTFGTTLDDFGADDTLDLKNLTYTSAASGTSTPLTFTAGTTPGSGTLSVTENGETESFSLSDVPTGTTYYAHDDGANGTRVDTVCFAAGTLIRTVRGDIAVEHLAVGDLVMTASGEQRPIKWIGHRTIDCRRHPCPHEAYPIRIAAHAFDDNRPARDLLVSPGHAICLDFLGEVLIPVGKLVNGATIARHPVDQVTYWHVELDSHDILIAENLPAESFLDCGNRAGLIEQEGDYDRTKGPHTPADFCRPFYDKGVLVAAARSRLAFRAEAQGWRSTSDMDLHLVVDGERIEADVVDGVARFVFPAAAREVMLASESYVPSDLADGLDHRRLGVSVSRIEIDDGLTVHRAWEAGDPALATLFRSEEAASETPHRFTDGRAVLPPSLWDGCRGFALLRVFFDPSSGTRWLSPGEAERGNVVALRVA